MAITPFAFDPPTGWNDSTVFPTYEASEAKVRSDMQMLHDQTRDYINGLVTEIESAQLLLIDIPSFDTLPYTLYDSRITANHILVRALPGNPDAVVGTWSVVTYNGRVQVRGTISGSTTLQLVLGLSSNAT